MILLGRSFWGHGFWRRLLSTGGGVLLLILGWPTRESSAQFFSPGPLARPHAQFEGLEQCGKCHEEKQHHSPTRCLTCHTELAPEITRGTGLHGRLTQEVRDHCERCHADHRGLDFNMIDFGGDQRKFDHQRTGWPLRGKHARIDCSSCHDRSRIVLPEVTRFLGAHPGRTTFLGLRERCTSCHFDEHRGDLGPDCQRCHNETAWKPVPLFNHQNTAFPLRGQHKGVACGKCHPSVEDVDLVAAHSPQPRAKIFMQMGDIDHRTCESCHNDPHDGKLGARCADCHTEVDWHRVAPLGDVSRAFHKKTAFPLVGAHTSVPCRSCHGPFPGIPARFEGLPFGKCSSCHEDAHLGQLDSLRGAGAPDCSHCHTVDSFLPPRFELEQHAQTPFPLDGAHSATACRSCHPLDGKLEARVSEAMRKKVRREERPLTVSLAVLRPRHTLEACSGCHVDIHEGQFTRELERHDCGACHKTSSFTDLRFDHGSDSRFPLTGAHRKAACGSCHPTESIRPDSPPAVRYQPLPVVCEGCHTDQHQGQFARSSDDASQAETGTVPRLSSDCSFCHRTESFKPTLFSHDDPRYTTFTLRGKHASLACDACHRKVAVAERVTTVRYRPMPTRCDDCHVDFHHGDFRGFQP